MGVSVADKAGVVVAEVTESITIDEAFGVLDSIAAIAEQSGARRALIAIDEASGLLDTLDRHKLGIHAARVLPRTMWLAVAAPSHLITPMFASTARTRGLTVKVFDDRGAAEAWLESD